MKLLQRFLVLLFVFLLSACGPIPTTRAVTQAVVPQPSPTSAFDISVLVWERIGGIAGFCDKVVVHTTGLADISSCKGLEAKITLTETQREQVDGWVKTLKPIDYIQSNSAVADAMTIKLTLAGAGTQLADEATIHAIGEFAAELEAQANYNLNAPPEKDKAGQALRDYLIALNSGDYVLGSKLYGGDTSLLETWNPDITNDLPKLFERACTRNGLVCLLPRSITYHGPDLGGGWQFLVEFSNADGTLFRQGPCCGEASGPSFTSFLFRVVKIESGYAVLDLPPYVP